VIFTWIAIVDAELEDSKGHDSNLSCGRSNGLGFANASGKTPVESTECGSRSRDAHGANPEDQGNPVLGMRGLGVEEPASGGSRSWSECEPRGKVFFVGPSVHVMANLGEKPQRGIGADAIDLR
jgi:hypothetical protein